MVAVPTNTLPRLPIICSVNLSGACAPKSISMSSILYEYRTNLGKSVHQFIPHSVNTQSVSLSLSECCQIHCQHNDIMSNPVLSDDLWLSKYLSC